jgi:adenosine deaminase
MMEHQQFSLRELQQTLLNSVAAAFLPAERKALLAQEIQQQWEGATC